jgi:hypothetical protein
MIMIVLSPGEWHPLPPLPLVLALELAFAFI